MSHVHTTDLPIPDLPPTFWQLLERRVGATPADRMLVDDRGRSLTFREYRDTAERVAAGLHELGVGEGTVVSWQLPTTLEAYAVLAALTRLGAISNPIVPILRAREVGFIARQVCAELIIVPKVFRGFDHAAMAEEIAGEIGARVLVVDFDAGAPGGHGLTLPDGDPATLDPVAPPPADLPVRWYFYSSGTTAEPKGSRHTDSSVMAGANGLIANLGLTNDDLYPVAFPVTHIGGTGVLTTCLATGWQLGVIPIFDAQRTPHDMAAMQPTFLGSALPFFHAYITEQRARGAEPLFPRLRAGVCGGAPKPAELHFEVKEVLGGVGLMSSWGLTEFPTGSHCSWDDDDQALVTSEGRIAPGVKIRVVSNDGSDCPLGVEGEIRVHGPQMFKGYLDPALDAAAWDEQGYLRTGDLGVVEEGGHVRITGRLKDIIIRNAENISAQEIEDLLYLHPKVKDVAVVGVPDPRTGERCCAVVQLADPGSTLTLAEIAVHCRANELANQKIPEQLEIVDALPRNAMGKLLKQQLRDTYAQR